MLCRPELHMNTNRKTTINGLMASVAAAGILAAPIQASAAGKQNCEDLLKATLVAAEDAGMEVESYSKTSVRASSAEATMNVTCSPTLSSIAVKDARGGTTTIENDTSGDFAYTVITSKFDTGAFLSKEYSFGEKTGGEQVHFAENADGESAQITGSFTPTDVEKDMLKVDFGDPETVNGGYSGREFRAPHWQAALELQFAWSGLSQALDGQGATPADVNLILESMATLPIPAQGATQDSDRTNTNRICTAGAAACVAGLLGIIGAGNCVLGGVACLAAGVCQAADCSGDG